MNDTSVVIVSQWGRILNGHVTESKEGDQIKPQAEETTGWRCSVVGHQESK